MTFDIASFFTVGLLWTVATVLAVVVYRNNHNLSLLAVALAGVYVAVLYWLLLVYELMGVPSVHLRLAVRLAFVLLGVSTLGFVGTEWYAYRLIANRVKK